MDENFYEQAIIERLCSVHGYEHLYGPDVPRSSGAYRDVFLPGVLEESLRRVNPGLPACAIECAVRKLGDDEGGSLVQRNETFLDYLQCGVEVRFLDGGEERDDIVRLVDYEHPMSGGQPRYAYSQQAIDLILSTLRQDPERALDRLKAETEEK